MEHKDCILACLIGLLMYIPLHGQEKKTTVYLFPGQGSDYRIFSGLEFSPGIDTARVQYPVPYRNETLENYASRLAGQIDTAGPYIFMGVSLGGMLAVELTDRLSPRQTILISSAKTRDELPGRYRWMKYLPLYKLFPAGLIKAGSRVAQPIVEPDRKHRKKTFKAMLKAKDKHFMKRAIHMIVCWERTKVPSGIYHLHGDKDHTLPLRNIQAYHVIPEGSHMMVLTGASKINDIIHEIMKKHP